VRVWLSRKLAEFVDGIDLRRRHVGDAFELGPAEAHLLIAEGYAALDRRAHKERRATVRDEHDRRAPNPQRPTRVRKVKRRQH